MPLPVRRKLADRLSSRINISPLFIGKGFVDLFTADKLVPNAGFYNRAKFFFSNEPCKLLASLPRSGTHYTISMITSVLELQATGETSINFKPNDYEHKLKFHAPFDGRAINHSNDILFFHTHMPYYRLKTMKKMADNKVLILVRGLIDQQTSNFYHKGYSVESRHEYSQDGHIESAIDFLNSWGKYSEKHPGKCKVIKFEDVKNDPHSTLQEIMSFLERDASDSHISQAIKVNDRKVVSKNLDETNLRISLHAHEPLPEDVLSHIKNQISQNLIYDFGYSYDT